LNRLRLLQSVAVQVRGGNKAVLLQVLSMKYSDEIWRLVAFISKSLSDTERNYEIHNKEILVVVRCLEV